MTSYLTLKHLRLKSREDSESELSQGTTDIFSLYATTSISDSQRIIPRGDLIYTLFSLQKGNNFAIFRGGYTPMKSLLERYSPEYKSLDNYIYPEKINLLLLEIISGKSEKECRNNAREWMYEQMLSRANSRFLTGDYLNFFNYFKREEIKNPKFKGGKPFLLF